MNSSGDAVDQIIRITTETGEVALRLAGSGAKQLALLIAALLTRKNNDGRRSRIGKERLTRLLKDCHREGAMIDSFTLPDKDYKAFEKYAGQFKINYAAVRDRRDGTVSVIFREADTGLINNALEKTKHEKLDPDRELIRAEPVEAAEREEPEIPSKKNEAPAGSYRKPGFGWTEWRQPTERAENEKAWDGRVTDVEVIEVTALPPAPERAALPAPEHYIAPGEKAPGVIHARTPENHRPQKLKYSVKERLYQIRSRQAAKTIASRGLERGKMRFKTR